jgi:uncharacterized protein (TIGR02246 family)
MLAVTRAKNSAAVYACAVVVAMLLVSGAAVGQAGKDSADATAAVKAVMEAQVAAWNAGDIKGFMAGYDNSPETTFVGKTVTHGWQEVLGRYEKNFPSKEKMGTLAFGDLEVRVLDAETAVVTGSYHLTRTAAGGGDASGIYSLVFRKTAGGWKIVLDHTNP